MNLGNWIFENKKKLLKVIYIIIILITLYYSIITIEYLFFLFLVIALWVIGVEDIEFFNTLHSSDIQRIDISYFTTGDIAVSIELLLIILVLILIIKSLGKLIK